MKYQDEAYSEMSSADLLRMEAGIHDDEYKGSMPFFGQSLRFAKEHAWLINDYEYKRGCYKRGFRKRRLFELIGLDDLAGKRVLDVGCGNGQHAVLFALYGAEVDAFDISPEGVSVGWETAKANDVQQQCRFSVQSISCLAYADESFDLIVFNAVLHHVWKYPNVKQETLRVLKPGGRVVFAEGLRSNPVYRAVRRLYRSLTGRSPQGDVDLESEDIAEFIKGFSQVYLESFCLSLGVKELIARPIDNPLPVRIVLYLLKRLDDLVLFLFPFARRYCSEIVGCLTK